MHQKSWLHKFEIKPGRWVYHPTESTKEYGADVLELLKGRFFAPCNYWHLRNGGHIGALRSHLNNSYFFKLDITDFFGSVSKTRVTRALRPLLGYEIAREVASRSTVSHPYSGRSVLPYGFKQSMMLASLVLANSAFGRYLRDLESKYFCRVSVYVDDIIVSGNNLEDLSRYFEVLNERAIRSRFSLSLDKTQTPSNKVTAFNIHLERSNLSVTDARMSEFLIAISKTQNQNVINGIKNYIKTINYSQWCALP